MSITNCVGTAAEHTVATIVVQVDKFTVIHRDIMAIPLVSCMIMYVRRMNYEFFPWRVRKIAYQKDEAAEARHSTDNGNGSTSVVSVDPVRGTPPYGTSW